MNFNPNRESFSKPMTKNSEVRKQIFEDKQDFFENREQEENYEFDLSNDFSEFLTLVETKTKPEDVDKLFENKEFNLEFYETQKYFKEKNVPVSRDVIIEMIKMNHREHTDLIDLNKKFSETEKWAIIYRKAKKSFEKELFPSLEQAVERSEEEMMPTEQYEVFSKIAGIIAKKYNFEYKYSEKNIYFSTNRKGGHSWYIFIKNPDYKEIHKDVNDFANEWRHLLEHGQCKVLKITDHFNREVQYYSKDEYPIEYTFVVDDQLEKICTIDTNYFVSYVEDGLDKYEYAREEDYSNIEDFQEFFEKLQNNKKDVDADF